MTALKILAAACTSLLLAAPAFAQDAMSSSAPMSEDAMSPMAPMSSEDPMAPMSSEDAMSPMAPMASEGAMMTTTTAGEVVAIMPDGHFGTGTMTGDKVTMTIGMSSALDHCVLFITGPDGKVYMVDTSSAAAQAECEAIAK